MGNLSSHEDCEPEMPCSADIGTPACRDLSYLDPRSPTLEIVRTPLEVPQMHRSRLHRLVSLLDPRSPCQHVFRTPLQLPCKTVQPVLEPNPQDADLEAIDQPEQVSVHAEEEQPTEHVDLKLARALFFGDMSAKESPAPSPVAEPSPAKAEEVVDTGEVVDPKEVVDPEEVVETLGTEQAKVACVQKETPAVAMTTKSDLGAVRCAERGTPTALSRRPGKENALKKQLFNTPDKARVRTPLSNVCSFHNSPLRR